MATFVTTTLTKRTGATTTVFSPMTIEGYGKLLAPATYVAISPELRMLANRQKGIRRTQVRVSVPQTNGLTPPAVTFVPYGQIELFIPDGTLQTDVNDIVGYLNALTATALTNLNSLLVVGEGVY
jgi:hypothetical protein